MGLLSKAFSESAFELDEMGKALRDRLLRFPQKDTSPDTALGLLKAYGAFQIGLGLFLKEGTYESYAAVGLGIPGIAIPGEKIRLSQRGIQRIDGSDLHPQLQGDLVFWAFPLDGHAPCHAVILIGTVPSAKFNAQGVEAILSQANHVFLLPALLQPSIVSPKEPEEGKEPAALEVSPQEPEPGARGILLQWIHDYARQSPEFQGILLGVPQNISASQGIDGYFKKLSTMVASFGRVFKLPANTALILFSQKQDRDLISHHLSRTLKTPSLITFLTDNPDKAFSTIQPYL